MARPPIGPAPMTPAERKRRQRERQRQNCDLSQKQVTKPKADRLADLERRVSQLESIIERLASNEVAKANPPEVVTEMKTPPTYEEIADFYWGPHFPGHVVGYKKTESEFSVDRSVIVAACEHEAKLREDIAALYREQKLPHSVIAGMFKVSIPYVQKAIAWSARQEAVSQQRARDLKAYAAVSAKLNNKYPLPCE